MSRVMHSSHPPPFPPSSSPLAAAPGGARLLRAAAERFFFRIASPGPLLCRRLRPVCGAALAEAVTMQESNSRSTQARVQAALSSAVPSVGEVSLVVHVAVALSAVAAASSATRRRIYERKEDI